MNRLTLLLLVALVLAAFGHAADNSEAIIRATKEFSSLSLVANLCDEIVRELAEIRIVTETALAA